MANKALDCGDPTPRRSRRLANLPPDTVPLIGRLPTLTSASRSRRAVKSSHDTAFNTQPSVTPTSLARSGQYLVKLFSNTQTFDFNENTTVQDAKLEIEYRMGVPPYQMRLIFNGKRLQDEQYLVDCNVTHHSTILLILSLCGGKPVIYLYPTKTTQVHVDLTLAPFWKLSHVYPCTIEDTKKSSMHWFVAAKAKGVLQPIDEPYNPIPYLFWEAVTEGDDHLTALPLMTKHTRIIPGPYFLPLLEGALRDLFLNVQQRADFITYWMPNSPDWTALLTVSPRRKKSIVQRRCPSDLSRVSYTASSYSLDVRRREPRILVWLNGQKWLLERKT